MQEVSGGGGFGVFGLRKLKGLMVLWIEEVSGSGLGWEVGSRVGGFPFGRSDCNLSCLNLPRSLVSPTRHSKGERTDASTNEREALITLGLRELQVL